MTRKRRRANPWLLAFLVLAIGTFAYVNLVIVPTTPPFFIPTATPTIIEVPVEVEIAATEPPAAEAKAESRPVSQSRRRGLFRRR